MMKKMKTKSFEEVRNALLVAKEIIEENLEKLNRLDDAEEETVTLRVQYEAGREDRYDIITIPKADLCDVERGYLHIKDPDVGWGVAKRSIGPLAGNAFILNDQFDWELGVDENSGLCLVPLKKEKEG